MNHLRGYLKGIIILNLVWVSMGLIGNKILEIEQFPYVMFWGALSGIAAFWLAGGISDD